MLIQAFWATNFILITFLINVLETLLEKLLKWNVTQWVTQAVNLRILPSNKLYVLFFTAQQNLKFKKCLRPESHIWKKNKIVLLCYVFIVLVSCIII